MLSKIDFYFSEPKEKDFSLSRLLEMKAKKVRHNKSTYLGRQQWAGLSCFW